MVLPIGIVAPLVYLNLNLPFAPPTSFLSRVLSIMASAFCYALTGCLTGSAAVLAFNFVAQRIGGIEAFVLVKTFTPIETSVHASSQIE